MQATSSSMVPSRSSLAAWIVGWLGLAATAWGQDPPRSLDPRVEIVRFAGAPEIVHPIALDFDRQGNLLVIESHTHFRPNGYQGPPHDRIRRVSDTNGDGQADRWSTFYEGCKATMDLAVHPQDGSVYVATRDEVFRLRDLDGDGTADERERIVLLETAGTYPHNGLSGLTFDAEGNLYFGLGENLGAGYRLVAADGSSIADEGEGGNVFWTTRSGGKLRRVATGFWNPFGLHYDRRGRLWCVDNDPDAAPPCRLLHVVEGGDYGYQFRYGRSGRHPFQAWNGQLLGTLPMVSGTGEAPCEVLLYEREGLPAEYHGELLVTSWADHRVERYRLTPRGASYGAERVPFIQGGTDFRPVGLAVAPDGSLMISDWVRRDYTLHGQGALWQIRQRPTGAHPPAPVKPSNNDAGPDAWQTVLERAEKIDNVDQLVEWLRDDDPYLRTAAGGVLTRSTALRDRLSRRPNLSTRERCGLLLAQRGANPHDEPALRRWLADDDEEARFLAVKWLADHPQPALRGILSDWLAGGDLNVRMVLAVTTALARIDGTGVNEGRLIESFGQLAFDDRLPVPRRLAALKLIPSTHKLLSSERLETLWKSSELPLRLEAVRIVSERSDADRAARLTSLALDEAAEFTLRAAAIVGLSQSSTVPVEPLVTLSQHERRELRGEALRALVGAPLSADDRSRLTSRAAHDEEEQTLRRRVLGEPWQGERPALRDTAAWLDRLAGPADPAAGERLFFHGKLAACYRCHRIDGRGQDVGPDLGQIGRTERRHQLESILQPSVLVAPHYQVWQLVLNDGRSLTGMLIHTNLDEYTYLDPRGETFKLRTIDIEETIASPLSIMPERLVEQLTDQELRDLLAYLERRK